MDTPLSMSMSIQHTSPRLSGNHTPMYAQQALLLPFNQNQLPISPLHCCSVMINYPICFEPT